MLHSALYYRFNQNLVEDHVFDGFCQDLVALQAEYPEIAAKVPFAKEFAGFDGSTGFHLAGVPWAVSMAQYLLQEGRQSA